MLLRDDTIKWLFLILFLLTNVSALPGKHEPQTWDTVYFVALPFVNGLQYRNSDFKRSNRMNFSTLCSTILVTFSPETSEFTTLTIALFAAIRQKSAYHAKYLRISWTYLDLLYRFGRRINGDDYPNIRLAVAQGTLLWQKVKFRKCSQTSRGMTFTLCFGIQQPIVRS